MKTGNKRQVKHFLKIRTAHGIRHLINIPLWQFVFFKIFHLRAVAFIIRVFNKESLPAHLQFLVNYRILIIDFSAAQRMPVQKIHVN